MAERCSRIQWLLERDYREFEEAIRGKVGTIFCSANDITNLDF